MGGRVSQKQFWAIKNSLTSKEREIIKVYELSFYLKNGYVPTVSEVAKKVGLKELAVNYHLSRAPVQKALNDRGIPWRQHSQEDLTQEQVAAAITVMNFADTRSIDDKLDQLGIQPATYYAWLNDPQFKTLVDSLANQNLQNIRPTAIAEFTKKVNKGDWRAIQYYFEATGEFAQNNAPQSEHLLRMIIEILQRHVKDPVVLEAIAKDIQLASQNRTLEVANTPPAIEAEVVEDPELEMAKKKLGIG